MEVSAAPALDLLVIGGSGFVGARAAHAAQSAGLSVACTWLNRPVPPGIPAWRLDVQDAAALADCLSALRPRAVIYAAVPAYASNDPAAHTRVSVEGLRSLLDCFRQTGIAPRLVYVSTNAVFSGRRGPYRESDAPDPDERHDAYRAYGLARRAGEELALSEWPDTVVGRTANVDGRDAWGRLNTRLAGQVETLRAGRPLPRFVDRTVSPTLVDNLAAALVEVARPAFAYRGVLHLAGAQPVTDYAYARALARRLALPETLVQPDHCLPPGDAGPYNIALDVTFTQSLLRTKLVGVDELLKTIF